MNYIKHLSSVFEMIAGDKRLSASHVSLYLTLFQFWNLNRFENPISINRYEVMRTCKIGSYTTYHRCLRELSEWNYIKYHPSHNPMIGSLIDMYSFGTSTDTTRRTSGVQVAEQLEEQVVYSSKNSINNKNIKTKKTYSIPTLDEVKDFFQDDHEAEKYFNYYSSKGWVVGNKSPMKDWKAAARNWKMNAGKFNSGSNGTNRSTGSPAGHLHINQDKDYNIPL